MSIGVTPENNSASVIFPDALAVYGYKNGAYVSASTIECGQAYWVAAISDHTVTVEGEQCTEWSRSFLMGWYLMGALYEDKPVSSLAPSSSVLIVYGFDTSTGQYVSASILEPGNGYWLAVSADANISLSKTGGQDIPLTMNKVSASDFLNKYSETPPPPPELQNEKLTEEEVNVPTVFKLSQNYPNPFNPETTIKFQIPNSSFVRLEIYNISGQKIKTLLNEGKSAGFYTIKWDGTNNNGLKVNSGVYIYRIQAGKFTDVKKMIFLK